MAAMETLAMSSSAMTVASVAVATMVEAVVDTLGAIGAWDPETVVTTEAETPNGITTTIVAVTIAVEATVAVMTGRGGSRVEKICRISLHFH